MSFKDCLDRVANETGIDRRRVQSIADRIGKKRREGMTEESLRAAIEQENIGLLRKAKAKQRQQAQSILNRQSNVETILSREASGMKLKEAMRSLQVGATKGVADARRSWSAEKIAIEGEYNRGLMAKLSERAHVIDLMVPGRFTAFRPQEKVRILSFHSDIEKEMRTPGSTSNADARFVSEVFVEAAERTRIDLNLHGADIGKLEGWSPQGHRERLMRQAGKNDWMAFIRDRLDIDRSFPDTTPAEVDDILSKMFDDITLGDPVKSARGSSNLANRLGLQRVIHFVSDEAKVEYDQRFGQPNVLVSMMDHMTKSARALTLLKNLGANPIDEFDKIKEAISKDIRGRDISHEKKTKLMSQLNSRELQNQFDVLTGAADVPHNNTAAAIGNEVRAYESLTNLGSAVFSAVGGDIPTYVATMRFNGVPVAEALKRPFDRLMRRHTGEDLRRINLLLNAGMEHVFGNIAARHMADGDQAGAISRHLETFFRLTGLTGFTDVMNAAASRMYSINMGWQINKTWKQLDDEFKHSLALHGIDEDRWAVARKAGLESVGGRNYYIPQRIRELDNSLFSMGAKGQIEELERIAKENRWSPDRLEKEKSDLLLREKKDLEIRMMSYFSDEARFAVLQGDDRAKATMTQAQRKGTIIGEAIRMIGQFKMFAALYSQRTMGRMWRGGQGGRPIPTQDIFGFFAMAIIGGYAAMSAKAIASGKTPADPTRPSTILAAMAQSGGLGIYGDFLFNKANRFGGGWLDTLSGPAIGRIARIGGIANRAIHGDPPPLTELTREVKQAVPGNNMWQLRGASDWLIVNRLAEALRPGSMADRERRMEEEFGQSFIYNVR